MAQQFDAHLSKPTSQPVNNLIEVHLTVNETISYKLMYENEQNRKSLINVNVQNETFMTF